MKQTINEYQFTESFREAGRGDSFSYDGLKALYEMLSDYEDSCETELELDPIAICCDFSESTASEIASDHGIDLSECSTQNETLSENIQVTDEFRAKYNEWLADFFGGVEVDEDAVLETVTEYLSENTWYATVDDNGADTTIVYQAF